MGSRKIEGGGERGERRNVKMKDRGGEGRGRSSPSGVYGRRSLLPAMNPTRTENRRGGWRACLCTCGGLIISSNSEALYSAVGQECDRNFGNDHAANSAESVRE